MDRPCEDDCGRSLAGLDPRRRFCDGCRLLRKRRSANEAKKRWVEKNPDARRAHSAKARIKHRYGLTLEEVDAMLEAQGGLCAIERCTKPATRIDHDHETGVVRGMLCHRCNILLSGLEDEDWREQALQYLRGEVTAGGIPKIRTG